MNENWRQPEADAHEAKAEAIELTIEHLSGIRDAVETPVDGMIGQLVIALQHAASRHRQAAKLIGAK